MIKGRSERRNLNHPYAYAHEVVNAGVRETPVRETPGLGPRGESRTVSGVVISQVLDREESGIHASPQSQYSTFVSAGIHMALLIVAALVFSAAPPDNTIELQVTTGPVKSTQPVETFVMDSEPDSLPDAEASLELSEPQFEIIEPSLASREVSLAPTRSTEVRSTGSGSAEGKSGRGSEFFGMAAYGDRFVYIVDISGSMGGKSNYGDQSLQLTSTARTWTARGHQTRFDVARRELLRSIDSLTDEQSFCVIMFSSSSYFMFGETPRLIPATSENKIRIREWANDREPGGGTDPRDGLQHAFRLKPDAVFLLSDGEFSGGSRSITSVVLPYRVEEIPIHTIAFESLRSRGRLRRIAEFTNGRHRYVGGETRQQILLWDIANGDTADVRIAIQKVLDEQVVLTDSEKAAIGIQCCRMMRTGRAESIRLAHECMVAMSDVDYGPNNRGKRQVVRVSATRWLRYWQAVERR